MCPNTRPANSTSVTVQAACPLIRSIKRLRPMPDSRANPAVVLPSAAIESFTMPDTASDNALGAGAFPRPMPQGYAALRYLQHAGGMSLHWSK